MKCPISYNSEQIVQTALKGGMPLEKMLDILITELSTCQPLFSMVKNHITRNGGNVEDAEDIFQESLIQLVGNLMNNKYRGNSNIENYTFGICKFKWLNYRRKKGLDTTEYIPAEQDKASDEDVETDFIGGEGRSLLWKIVEQVSGHCPEYLKLWALGYKHKEIAAKLGVTLTRAERNTSKCRKRLLALLDKQPKLKQIINEIRFW